MDQSGLSTLQLALGFAALAIVAGLLGSPLAASLTSGRSAPQIAANPGIDTTVTGSVKKQPVTRTYTIRRSVLQKDPSRVCKIWSNGHREGDC